MKKRVIKLLILAMLFIIPILRTENCVVAKVSFEHQVFTKKQISKRINVIKKNYSNLSRMKIKSQKVCLEGNRGKMNYYFRGSDLMFSFGNIKGIEYRGYYYKNQLIKLLIDEPQNNRKTYVQYYKKEQSEFMTDYYTTNLFFDMENYARKIIGTVQSVKEKDCKEESVVITKMKGNIVWYHPIQAMGPDGSFYSIRSQTYRARLDSKISIIDSSVEPNKKFRRKKGWLKKHIDNSIVGALAYLTVDKGKAKKIVIPYLP